MRNAAQLTQNVTTYTHSNDAQAADIRAAVGDVAPITVDSRRIVRLEFGPDGQVGWPDATSRRRHLQVPTRPSFLGHKPKSARR